jgi:CDP-glycerol glycerophosphotransferase
MRDMYPQIDVIWLTKHRETSAQGVPGIRVVGPSQILRMWAIATSKVWVGNHFRPFVRFNKKPNQYYVQTFHGSYGIKKIGYDQLKRRSWQSPEKIVTKFRNEVDLVIVDSELEKARMTSAYRIDPCKIRILGHARTDPFFRDDTADNAPTMAQVPIVSRKKMLLFVPSHGFNFWPPPPVDLLRTFEAKFGGNWELVMKAHPKDVKANSQYKEILKSLPMATRLVADVEDVTELLLRADAVITDQSSAVFDFLHTGRPAFIVLPRLLSDDFNTYCYGNQSAYPMPIVDSWEELIESVNSHSDEQYQTRIKKFLAEINPANDGRAASRAAEMLGRLMIGGGDGAE